MPELSAKLCNFYYMLRYKRNHDQAARRRYYRYIAAEKKRLQEAGVNPELVRLLCRYLSNPRNQHAEARYLFFKRQYGLFDGLKVTPADFT